MIRVFVVILDPFLVQFFLVGRHGVVGMLMEFILIVVYDPRPPRQGRKETLNDER